jgi:Ion channel
MATPLQRVWRFLRGDGSLTVAVCILALWIFLLAPLREMNDIGGLAGDLAFAAVLALGAIFVFEPRPVMRLFLLFLVAAMVVRVVDVVVGGGVTLDALGYILAAIAAFMLGTLLLVRVLRDGRINVNRIIGSVGVFLLIGIVFANGYRLVALYADGAFAIGGTPVPASAFLPRVVYFSFVTLSTLGYGDITPVHPFARSLVMMEAVTGQLFLAILVARLVAMEIEWRHGQRDKRDDTRARDQG